MKRTYFKCKEGCKLIKEINQSLRSNSWDIITETNLISQFFNNEQYASIPTLLRYGLQWKICESVYDEYCKAMKFTWAADVHGSSYEVSTDRNKHRMFLILQAYFIINKEIETPHKMKALAFLWRSLPDAIDVDNLDKEKQYDELRKSRGYDYEDLVEISKDTLPEYDEKIKAFYTEHLHTDEEIRLFLKGSGYFDVRDKNDKWIRIKAAKGDLLVLPAGIYHRFTPDNNNYAKVMRLFCGTPVWKAYNRPADDNPARVKYLNTIAASA
ncbi:1 like protein [Argiope bruennichi]|uniref:Acireductone dioxygenase n=1 Tax=Argiope bruennichi TaxID=94029 RepID=A0A8T0F8R1_ARGBR|nr:1 like protein [Argiope bruennichi]